MVNSNMTRRQYLALANTARRMGGWFRMVRAAVPCPGCQGDTHVTFKGRLCLNEACSITYVR